MTPTLDLPPEPLPQGTRADIADYQPALIG